ncbi:hypothetical protein JJJ17_02075 [Paracoccus caeni]|uniref:Uncharacterized protein n=1 Tax=Paracoccus caeni TaxID=657651 RepID=A0A934SD46_9RHOB|nr:hypothetical protein [Paracoccus caeni]MBK4214706.1 hypothetical protein [Paracoccus caeni]
MMEFRVLSDDHADLNLSPLLRAARLTIGYADEHDGIGLTATKAFRRDFVHWAVEQFDWPGQSAAEVFRHRKLINEADFQPLELLHFLLIRLQLGRHHKGSFKVNNDGRMFAAQPGTLFDRLVPSFLFAMDHAAYSRIGEPAPGNWNTWLNVMNVEIESGISERQLYGVFYGEGPDWDNDGWRQIAAFSASVLKPLEWAGLIAMQEAREPNGRLAHMIFKTPLWQSVLRLDTDDMVRPVIRH